MFEYIQVDVAMSPVEALVLLRRGLELQVPGNTRERKKMQKIDQMEKTIGRLALENDILKKTQELIR